MKGNIQQRGPRARRSRSTGSITERGPGRWRLRAGYQSLGGKRKWRSETVRGTKKDAEARLRLLLGEIELGVMVTADKMGDYLDQWLNTVKPTIAPKTHYDYSNSLKYVTNRYGHLRLKDLRGNHIQMLYTEMLNRGLSTRTVKLLHVVLGSALKAAVKWGYIAYSPSDRVTAPKQERREIQAWSKDEVHRFTDQTRNHHQKNLYQVLIYTGLRRAELCGLKWGDIDFDNRTLSIRRVLHRVVGNEGLTVGDTKTKRSRRTITLGKTAIQALKQEQTDQLIRKLAAPAWVDEDWVFTNQIGGPVDADDLTRNFRNLIKDTGLTQISLHGLRHTYASLMILAGVNAKEISDSLGHSSVAFTLDVYGHLYPAQRQDAADALDALMKTG